MPIVRIATDDREFLRTRLTTYLQNELNVDLGRFEADFMLDMIVETFGPYFYNAGLRDAQAALLRRIDDVRSAIDELERPLPNETRRRD
jgi:uncharacterized protein (DUF2164 family)